MAEFASCYFCGTALDAQIDPYPVVPEEAGTDERPTVDLCPVCRRKLSKVLDVALSAAEGAETTATPLAAGPDPSPLSADHEDPTADLEDEDGEADGPAYAVEPSGEATAVGDSEGERSDSRDSADDAEAETGEPEAADTDTSDVQAVEADEAVANGEASGTVGGDAESEATDEADSSDDETEVAAETDTETEADERDGSDQPSILSTPAAKKVIKLLQNREFPVEREEIEVVASNAYAIPQQDCEDVLDALVSEGYVGERNGRLVRPEE